MHQLLQEMAKKIVNDESTVSASRSRVWNAFASYNLLHAEEGSETTQGLALDMRKVMQSMTSEPTLEAVKTSSLSKMKKLKLLRLIDVQLDGDYNKFPKLRWLCWHKCHLKNIPSGLFTRSLVAIEMSNGECKNFKPPVGLNSLKILNFKGCHKLVGIYNLYRLPNLESLILWDCSSLTYLCTTIGSLKRLALLDLTGCKMLWNVAWWFGCFGGGNERQLFFSLPASLEFLFLNNFLSKDIVDVPVLKSDRQSLYINLGNSLFKFLPKAIDNVRQRVLDLTACSNLESLIGLPSTLEELYTYRCASLEKITFQSARFRLQKFGYGGCTKLSEIQGLFKLVPVKELDEANLFIMKWIKRYQDYQMDLVGDEITKGRIWHIQMLYEYGIRSTFLPRDQSMNMPENMIFSPFFSFLVGPQRHRIDGLLLTSLYRSSGEDAADMPVLFAKISNKTKGLSWIYNPVVFGKPKVGEDVVLLSYWPNRDMVDTGDEVVVSIIGGNGLTVTAVAFEYLYDIAEQEISENYTEEVEVIGGNLSEFELTRGAYYLCRRDFFKRADPDWLKILIRDTFDYTELQGWRKARQTFDDESFMGLQTYRGIHCGVEITPRSWAGQEDSQEKTSGYNIAKVAIDLLFGAAVKQL